MSRFFDQEFAGNDRFAIRRRLGAGAMGVVYHAYDRDRGFDVALKTLRKLDATSIYRFKKEFRALADVKHLNLIGLHELVRDGDDWFFTMELIRGVDFVEHIVTPSFASSPRREPETKTTERIDPHERSTFVDESLPEDALDDPTLTELDSGLPGALDTARVANLERLRPALAQLCQGLSALHRVGKLHRDLKPSNILVTPSGRLVILDFGLVAELDPEHTRSISEQQHLAGTFAYMAPEAGSEEAFTPASDWYSVGVLLFEALTGRLPFIGSGVDVLLLKQRAEPPPPSQFAPFIPEDLEALCMDLLAIDPAKRPNGEEILRRLDVVSTSLSASEVAPRTSSPPRRPFIGRHAHLSALESALASVESGFPMMVLLRGAAGIGKTSLVRRFLEEMKKRPETVIFTGRCHERESVPHKAIDGLVDASSRYLGQLPPARAPILLPRGIRALAKLFPVLDRVPAVAQAPRLIAETPDPQELRRRAFEAFRELFGRIADQNTLVLFVDDMQWGDEESAELLLDLLRPPDPPAVLVVLAFRSEDEAASPVLRSLLSARRQSFVRSLSLGALTFDEARDLAITLIGDRDESSWAIASRIAEEAHGSPFFVSSMVHHSRKSETSPDELTLEGVIRARLEHLPTVARTLLELVVLRAGPLRTETALLALGQSPEALEVAIDTLRAGSWVRSRSVEGEAAIELFDALLGKMILQSVPAETLAERHCRLALALEEQGEVDAEALSAHFAAGGEHERAGVYAGEAAARAFDALAFQRAASLYRLALRWRTLDEVERRELLTRLGDALACAGRGAEAARSFLEASKSGPKSDQLQRKRLAAEQLLISGHLDHGLEVLEGVLEESQLGLAGTPGRAYAARVFRSAQLWKRGLAFEPKKESDVDPAELRRLDLLWSVCTGLSMVDYMRAADFIGRHLIAALEAGEPSRIARGAAMEACYSGTMGEKTKKRSLALIRLSEEIGRDLQDPHVLGMSQMAWGLHHYLLGEWGTARPRLEEAERIFRDRCRGAVWEVGTTRTFLLGCLFHLGEAKSLFRRLSTLLDEAETRGDLYQATGLRVGYANAAWLLVDNPDRARAMVDEAMGRWSQSGYHLQHFLALLARSNNALYTQEPEVAHELFNGQRKVIESSQLLRIEYLRIEAEYLRGRTALAAMAAGSFGESALREEAELAERRLESESAPVTRGLARLIRAGLFARRGASERSAVLLEEASEIFDATSSVLMARFSRLRRGQLIGGEDGAAVVRAETAQLIEAGVRNPQAAADAFVPPVKA